VSPFISWNSSGKSPAAVSASDARVSSRRATSDRESSPYQKMLKRRKSSEKNARYSAVSWTRKLRISMG
jgi:hypothetical protein